MNLLSVSNLAKIGREKPLFTDVVFGLQESEKAALIGRNGTGKSTLLNTVAGVLQPDEGIVVFNKDAGVSFLPQNPEFNAEDTVKTHIFKSKSPKLKIIREYFEICDKLAENAESFGVQKEYQQIMLKMEQQDLWNYESQISSVLTTLGIKNLNLKMATLSGGMIKKVALAQVLVEDTKILLLDEPTNHLDITTISWLQNYLKETKRSVLMVTHDRYFLDAVCNKIYELERGKLKLYEGNYSQYLEKKTIEAEIEKNTERRIESVLRFERDWLLRGPCARGTKIKARIQRDEQLINREKFQEDKGFSFEVKGKRLGGKVLELHKICKNFCKASENPKESKMKNVPVIKNFSYVFTKGQKIGIFGDNGTGKSTLLNLITGQIQPDSGSIEAGINTKFGYYNQNPVFKNTNLTVLEYIKETAEHITLNSNSKEVSASKFLERFGFEGKIQHSPVSTLSGGERKRLFLVKLLLENPNFLILDEPTNDFDIFTMNILEQFLMDYEGCLLLVSHDRYFMDKTVDSLFIMEDDGNISGFAGKCSEYIEYKAEILKTNKEDIKVKEKKSNSENNANDDLQKKSEKKQKLTFSEKKEFELLNEQIPELEKKQKILEEKMACSDFAQIKIAAEQYKEISALLEEKYERWEILAEKN